MNDPLFLTADELKTLTGYSQKSRQCGWLRERKWKFEANAFGDPNVSRDYANQRLGASKEPARTAPEWGNLRLINKAA